MPDLPNATAFSSFRPMPGHNPRSKADRYKRVQYYVAQLADISSSQMKQALLVLKNAADELPAELRETAIKPYTETEFLSAVKEFLCMQIHFEIVEQGSETMQTWLMQYFKLALHATDQVIPEPAAIDIMASHAECTDLEVLVAEVSTTIATYLGFGANASTLAPAFVAMFNNTRPARQKILKDSLTIVLDDLE